MTKLYDYKAVTLESGDYLQGRMLSETERESLEGGLRQIPKRNLRALLGRMERGLEVLLDGSISRITDNGRYG